MYYIGFYWGDCHMMTTFMTCLWQKYFSVTRLTKRSSNASYLLLDFGYFTVKTLRNNKNQD